MQFAHGHIEYDKQDSLILEACFGIIADKGFYSPPPMESGGVYCN
jgi:hypothetical protein